MLIQMLARTLESSARSTYGRLEYRSLLQVILIHGTVAMKKKSSCLFLLYFDQFESYCASADRKQSEELLTVLGSELVFYPEQKGRERLTVSGTTSAPTSTTAILLIIFITKPTQT